MLIPGLNCHFRQLLFTSSNMYCQEVSWRFVYQDVMLELHIIDVAILTTTET